MRSALICLFFAVIVRKEGSRAEQDDDFRPTPIPLNNWTGENQVPAGTLQEFIKTDLPPTIAVIPAHYWEDALRHSVYLTIVRDKIDQLIAKGVVISPDSKPDGETSKEVDDHDLWEKIKTAPFDRVNEEPLPPSDSIILARGRLLEEKDGYRFAEGDVSPEKCNKNNCTQAVKAYWSVKRTRQAETSPGKYHYELTFSVTSQSTKALRKQYENPVRTFTIRENAPTERPLPLLYRYQGPQIQHERAQRAIWVHKNIGPSPNYQKKSGNRRGLERLFSSLFSDEDNYDDSSFRQKPIAYIPQGYHTSKQHAKISRYSEREPIHQKKIYTYPVKPPSFRYPRPPLQPPPLSYMPHSYFDVSHDAISHIPIDTDNKPIPSNPVKTTKPAVLPTPIATIQMFKEPKVDELMKTTVDVADFTTKEPEMSSTTYKEYPRKQTAMKVNYLPENIRPPIYNAPPGVFVTMDKKPFKPMPPLKSISPKPHKTMPFDFRPSPQILDTSYTNTDSTADTAFRPMSLNLTELLNTKKGPKIHRKPVTAKKPPKKHDNIKPTRLTTVSPDIITIQSEEENSEIRWAEILAAFTRTTPMASQKEKENAAENDFIIMTTIVPTTTTEKYEEKTTRTSTTTSTTTTTTTRKPKRTRPPPKFKKPEKFQKHKRVTSTTASSTTTGRPTRIYPTNKISGDLTPQASSAATNGVNSLRESKPIGAPASTSSTTTTTTSTSTSTPTTSRTLGTTKISTTTITPSTTVNGEAVVVSTQPKSKNRFRQTMLMQKGTSINHDKWSMSTNEKNRTTSIIQTSLPLRRKASKFQGYIPPSTPRSLEKEKNKEDHKDHGFSSNMVNFSSTTTQSNEDIEVKTPPSTEPTVKDTKINKGWIHDMEDSIQIETEEKFEPNDVRETKDRNEFIFPITPSSNNNSNVETQDKDPKTNPTVLVEISVENNKTKCKKKKHQNLTTTDILKSSSEIETSTITIHSSVNATSSTVSDLFDEFLGGFTMDDVTEQPKTNISTTTAPDEPNQSESVLHEEVFQTGNGIENFLNSLQQIHDKKSYDEYEEDDDQDSPFENDEDSRDIHEDYYDESEIQAGESQERPFSLLELMAME